MPRHLGPLALLCLAVSAPARAQGDHVLPAGEPHVQWYAGDTHEHFQGCFTPYQLVEDILARLEAEDLSVGSVLVWDPDTSLSFTEFACLVSGTIDPLSTPEHQLQFGIETSGLDCGKWGHLIGLGIGPQQALIATSSLAAGDCADTPGLAPGCGGDGTGVLAAPIAELFYQSPDAVCGYAHAIWPVDDYFVNGFPWHAELVASSFTRDARCIDPGQRLAVPNLSRFLVQSSLLFRTFFPLLGAADAVLGDVEFLETITLGPEFPFAFSPAAHWHGLHYRLASLGLRVALAAGSDEDCAFIPQNQLPRTYVWLDEPFSYAAWTRGLAAGHTSVGLQGLRIDLRVNGKRPGEDLYVPSLARLDVRVEVESDGPLSDGVELLADGVVIATRPLSSAGGRVRIPFRGVSLPESTWLAARLTSQNAHTGALYVYADGRPISDCEAAEYWMLWCDIVGKTTLQVPQLQLFGCQRVQALARLMRARRAFKAYRDVEGFEPGFEAERYGLSTPGSRGPISIGTTARARSHQSLLLTCVNAPPLADGTLLLSRSEDPSGTCEGDVRVFVDTDPAELLGTFPARSTRSGYAEVLIPAVPHGEERLFAQFLWTNPPGQPAQACGEEPAVRSASDALVLEVEVPPLTGVAVTPVGPSIARGTSLGLTAMGFYADGAKHDVTSTVQWSSSDPSVASVTKAAETACLATGLELGTAEIVATDLATGLAGATTLQVTPAVLQTLEVAPTQVMVAQGFDQPFVAIGTFTDATTQDLTQSVAWSSSNPAVAVVSPAGLAESLAVGSAAIEATDHTSEIAGSAQLVVSSAVLSAIEVTPMNAAIPLGRSQAFRAIGVFSNDQTLDLSDSVSWTSSDPSVAGITLGPDGLVLASSVTVGLTEIRATDPESGLGGTTSLEVTPAALVELQVSPAAPEVALGFEQPFQATGIFTDATTQDLTAVAVWSSADPAVAVLSNAPGSEGRATSLAVGTTLVTATDPATQVSAATPLTVTPAVLTGLRLAPEASELPLGLTLAFAAEGLYSDGSTQALTSAVTWSSSDPGVAVLSNAPGSEGLATSLALGTTLVRATDPASSVEGTASLTITPAVLTTLEVLPPDPAVALGFALGFTAVGTYSDATTQELTGAVTWSSSDPAVAVVSNAPGSQGLATTLAVGQTSVVATDPASQVEGSTQLTVTPAVLVSLALAPADAVIGLGTDLQFSATGTYSDGTTLDVTADVTWSSSDPAVAVLGNAAGSEGLATSLSVGTTLVTALSPGTGISASTTLTVRPVLQSLTVLPANRSILVGTSLAYSAIGSFNDGSTQDLTLQVLWSSSNPSVATIDNAPDPAGLAHALVPGLTTVTATDPATSLSGTASLRVLRIQ